MGDSRLENAHDETMTHIRGLSPSRLEQLRRDLALTPEQRVRAAEDTLRLDRQREPADARRVVFFERYEDYLDYKFKTSAGGA